MILELLLLSRALQEPNQLKVLPNQTIVSTTGRATLASGAQIELIGACELSEKNLRPWGYDGNALTVGQESWFWHALGERHDDHKVRSMWREDKTTRTFSIALRAKPDLFLHLPFESISNLNVGVEHSGPPEPALGFTWGVDSFIFCRPEGDRMDFTIDAEPFDATRLFEFVPEQENLPAGFGFKFKERRSNALVATKGNRQTLKIINYVVRATVPKQWRECELVLTTSDKPQKGGVPILPNFDHGQQSGDEVLFTVSAVDRPGYRRSFILAAKTKTVVTFKDVPLKPNR